jgi:PKD repeat protein
MPQQIRKLVFPLLIILVISITSTFGQGENDHTIYLSGQLTNIQNGAPIKGRTVYVQTNAENYGGFNYFAELTTNAWGFFYDTISIPNLKGAIDIYTFDYSGTEHRISEYFRFNWEDEYNLVTELNIPDPGTISNFQADFDPLQDTLSSNPLSYYFIDKSTGAEIVSWRWDFGDGSTSSDENNHHVYMEPGIYNVKLSVSTSPTHQEDASIITKKVKVGMREYYNFGGTAFAGYFPVDIGTAFLYKIENDQFIPIDTTEFDEYGFYLYYQLIEGEYIVKTFPAKNSVNAGQYLPTYFGNTLFWTKATSIYLNATAWEYDISMIENFEYSNGSGAIDGSVSFEGKSKVVDNVEIILFNEQDNCLTYIQSNPEGLFKFNGLGYGTYKVMAEVPGMYTYSTSITLSEETPYVEDLSIVVYEDEIPFGIGDDDIPAVAGLGRLYPNPAQDHINLEFSLQEAGQAQIFILNQAGQIADKYSKTYANGNHNLQINTSAFSAGMYKVMFLFGNEKHIKSFVKIN